MPFHLWRSIYTVLMFEISLYQRVDITVTVEVILPNQCKIRNVFIVFFFLDWSEWGDRKITLRNDCPPSVNLSFVFDTAPLRRKNRRQRRKATTMRGQDSAREKRKKHISSPNFRLPLKTRIVSFCVILVTDCVKCMWRAGWNIPHSLPRTKCVTI